MKQDIEEPSFSNFLRKFEINIKSLTYFRKLFEILGISRYLSLLFFKNFRRHPKTSSLNELFFWKNSFAAFTVSLLITHRIYIRRSAGKKWNFTNARETIDSCYCGVCVHRAGARLSLIRKWNSISSKFLGRFKTINSRAAISWIFRKWKSYDLDRSSSPNERIYFLSSLDSPFRTRHPRNGSH